jgi:hypothetical protein
MGNDNVPLHENTMGVVVDESDVDAELIGRSFGILRRRRISSS